jgi:hypothetical protein
MAEKEKERDQRKLMESQLEEILKNGEAMNVRPAPNIQIQALQDHPDGLELLVGLDKAHSRLAFDPRTKAFLCVWNGPRGEQVLFVNDNKARGLTAGIFSQITLTGVELENGEATLCYTPSSADKDKQLVEQLFGLKPGQKYQRKIKIVDLNEANFLELFQSGKSVEEAVGGEKTIQERAEAGDADAQLQLGHLYESGEGVPKDYAEAAKWYRKAAEQGNAEPQLYLGCSYATGRGVPKDSAEHLKWIRKAAQQGLADAQVQLGLLYEIGQEVPKDFAAAYMWMNLAATGGNKEFGELRNLLEKRMTREQLIEGQKLTEKWLERKAKETGE